MNIYLIYGKVIKSVPLSDGKGGKRIVNPQSTFRALNYAGQRVSRLADAGEYYEKEMAQKVINKAKAHWDKEGYGDCIVYEIRKAK